MRAGPPSVVDDAALARGLGWGTLVYEAVVLTLLFKANHLFLGLSGGAYFFLWVGFPLALSIVGTVLYARLPKERQRTALIAPISLIVMLLLPVVVIGYFLYDFGTHGPA